MKWSVLLRWSRDQGVTSLDWLGGVPVTRSHWFPDWIKARRDSLRVDMTGRVQFLPRTAAATLESLPLLTSRSFNRFPGDAPETKMSGGVSLAKRDLLATRAPISEAVSPSMRRGALDFGASSQDGFATLSKTSYSLRAAAGRYEVRALASEEQLLRGSTTQLARTETARVLRPEPGGIAAQYRLGDTPIGELRVSRAANGFRVGWQGRDLDSAVTLAHRLGALSTPDAMVDALVRDVVVSDAYSLANGGFLVRLRGSEGWLQLAPDAKPAARLAEGWQGRVGDLRSRIPGMNLKFMDAGEARALQESAGATRRKFASTPSEAAKAANRSEPEVLSASLGPGEPGTVRRALEQRLTEAVAELDAAVARGDVGAGARIDELIQVYGPRPDLLARRAIAQIRDGRLSAAARTINRASGRVDNATSFFDELAAQLKRHHVEGAGDVERQVAAFRQWANASRQLDLDRQLSLVGTPDGLASVCAVGPKVETRVIRSATELPAGQSLVYVQDKAGVYYLDPSLSAHSQLPSLLSSGRLELLPAGDIAHYKPAALLRTQQAGLGSSVSIRRIGTTGRHLSSLDRCDGQEPEAGGSGCPRVYLYTPAETGN